MTKNKFAIYMDENNLSIPDIVRICGVSDTTARDRYRDGIKNRSTATKYAKSLGCNWKDLWG